MDSNTVEVRSEQSKLSFVTAGPSESLKRRSRRLYNLAYEQSQGYLFLDDVHSIDKSQGCGITPFFVRRSVYLAFFGHLPFHGQSTVPNPPAGAADWPQQETGHQC